MATAPSSSASPSSVLAAAALLLLLLPMEPRAWSESRSLSSSAAGALEKGAREALLMRVRVAGEAAGAAGASGSLVLM